MPVLISPLLLFPPSLALLARCVAGCPVWVFLTFACRYAIPFRIAPRASCVCVRSRIHLVRALPTLSVWRAPRARYPYRAPKGPFLAVRAPPCLLALSRLASPLGSGPVCPVQSGARGGVRGAEGRAAGWGGLAGPLPVAPWGHGSARVGRGGTGED